MLEGYTALGYAAAHAKRARLGLMVGGIHYRQPGLWLKAATTLDVLTGGRSYFGIGAAWNQEESEGLGFAFPELRDRFRQLEDTLKLVHAGWTGEHGTGERFEGRTVTAERILNSPQALSKPHPPILIGGGGEQRTLRLVARYADACNVFGNPDNLRRKYGILEEHCLDVGREYAQIEKTNLTGVAITADGAHGSLTPDAFVQRLGAWAEAGSMHTIFSVRDVWDTSKLELIGRDVIPQVRSLGDPSPID
jgi:alkanesulfonate monooxygenase SsuD/methylene tetrahydromethanopterin reductase-like flavin-dependent oxidoreductase (luciferase family)